ncbi:MAG: O-methyltransferase [Candidatus Cloacimonetes bacterium]|nr:O-methyltransferase [Candidatus Cloacimonadota bacterium]
MNFETINKYIADLYANKTSLTRSKYESSTELKDFVPVVDDDVAMLLRLLLQLTCARRVLEIGTSIGYSTTSMAQVVKKYDGKIITIEFDEKVASQAQTNFKRAGVADFIELQIGDAQVLIPQLQGDFDLIFQDVDKRLYPRLLPDCIRLLKQGGLLVAEDTLFPVIDLDPEWHHLIPPIEEFNHLVANNPELESTILPIGDGVTLAIKK